jgi:hypothetical protein
VNTMTSPSWLTRATEYALGTSPRHARPIALFRMFSGIALALYFADHYANSVPLIAGHGLYDHAALQALGVPVRTAAWLTESSSGVLRTFFAGAIALSLLGSAGVRSRVFAGILFVLAVLTARALHPINHLDDYLATATLFWLTLLPSALSPVTRAFWRTDAGPQAHDGTALVFVGYVAVLYFGLGLRAFGDSNPAWSESRLAPLGCFLIAALVLAPGTWAKVVGAAVQILLHGYFLITADLSVGHLLLLATGIVLWAPPAREVERGSMITAPVMLGALHVALFAAVQLLPLVHPALVRPAMARLMFDAGLLPAERRELQKTPFALKVTLPDRPEVVVHSDHVRFQLLLAHLSRAPSDDPQDAFRQDMAQRLLVRYCPSAKPTVGSALVLRSPDVPTHWDFTCPPPEGSGGKGPFPPTVLHFIEKSVDEARRSSTRSSLRTSHGSCACAQFARV